MVVWYAIQSMHFTIFQIKYSELMTLGAMWSTSFVKNLTSVNTIKINKMSLFTTIYKISAMKEIGI